MNKTNIEYLDYTWNVTHGCSKICIGCRNCWAELMAKRLAAMGVPGYDKDDPFKVTFCPDRLNEPFKIKKPSRIGVSFMGDLFHEDIKYNELEKIFFQMVYPANIHTYLILTKRPSNMLEFLRQYSDYNIISNNIQFGISISTQKDADEMIPILLQIKAMFPNLIVFVSVEPMLERIDLTWINHGRVTIIDCLEGYHGFPTPHEKCQKIDWVIIGNENAPKNKRRDCKLEDIEDLVQQCESAGIPVFVKQAVINGKLVKMPEINGKVYDQYPKGVK